VNVEAIRERYAATKRAVGDGVTVVAATKYVSLEDMAALAEAGVEVVGENRVQDMLAKHAEYGDAFRWHFIGRLQSNKAKAVNGVCELVHAVDTDSTARRLTIPWLLEVNLSGEESKGGVPPDAIGEWVTRYPGLRGLMTMPAPTADPEDSRPVFKHLHALADYNGLHDLSIGTSQDWPVAVEEGATYVRIGSALWSA
jgi:pyridoxal phosphate enzyme (YggS family)